MCYDFNNFTYTKLCFACDSGYTALPVLTLNGRVEINNGFKC